MANVVKSMSLLPEYQEKFLKDLLANIYRVDDETGEISGIAATSPLYGQPVVDADGNPVYEVDADGNFILDQYGNKIQQVKGGVAAPDVIQFTRPQVEALELMAGRVDADGNIVDRGTGLYQPYLDTAEDTIAEGLQTFQSGVRELDDTSGAYDPSTAYKDFYDPYIEDVLGSVKEDIQEQEAQRRMQQQAQMISQGAFSNRERRDQLEEDLARGSARALADASSRLRSAGYTGAQQQAQSAFENQMKRGQSAAQLFGSLGQGIAGLGVQQGALGEAAQAQRAKDVNTLFNIGALEQQQLQREFDVDRAAQQEEAYEPFGRFGYMRDILSGLPSGVTSSSYAYQPNLNPVANLFSGMSNMGMGGQQGGLGSLVRGGGGQR